MRHFIKKHLSGIARVMLMTCHLVVVIGFAASVSAAENNVTTIPSQPVGVDADADALLRTLAELAREGVPALCNSPYLEKKLNIKIDSALASTSENSRRTLVEVKSVSFGRIISNGRYGKFSNEKMTKCYLSVDFDGFLLCDAASVKIQNILGEKVEYTSPFPGRSTQGIFYIFRPNWGGQSRLSLGTSDDECVYGFVLAAEDEIK